jgi:hypothetical protein
VDVTLGNRSGEFPSSATGERPGGEPSQHHHAAPIDRSSLRRPADQTGSVYRGRHTGLAVLLIALTVIFEIPAFRVFASSALAHTIVASGTFASMFMIAGLPLFALGLYGLIGGGAAAPGLGGGKAWLRPPLAYLPLGLMLFVVAAIAA